MVAKEKAKPKKAAAAAAKKKAAAAAAAKTADSKAAPQGKALLRRAGLEGACTGAGQGRAAQVGRAVLTRGDRGFRDGVLCS